MDEPIDPDAAAGGTAEEDRSDGPGTSPVAMPEASPGDVGGGELGARSAEERARELGVRHLELGATELDRDLLSEIPIRLMVRYSMIPVVRQEDGSVLVAMADPMDLDAVSVLESHLESRIEVAVAEPAEIDETLRRAGAGERILRSVTSRFEDADAGRAEEGDERGLTLASLAEEEGHPIVRLLDTIILNALERRASDVHIETRDSGVWVKYRIDGVLYPAMEPIELRHHGAILSRIKVMSELDIAEKRIPQDGRFKLNLQGRTVDFRVSVMPSIFGEDAVIRILDKEHLAEEFAELSLTRLGFSSTELRKIGKYIREPYGMLLVTGPTGSGKTTSLYAALSEIRSEEEKIITIEDPVEYQLPGVTQIPVNEKKGLTFARGLRSILRHDPDVIMVGEIRDPETASIAVQSALTGHLVFTTVHANNVVDVIGRLLNMEVEPYNFVSSLNCVLAQRLVRTICSFCKREAEIDPGYLEESGVDPDGVGDVTFYEGAGCPECRGTGFHGRTVIVELLDLSDRIREMILARRPASEIRQQAVREGMTTLRESALEKCFAGITTLREVNKVTFVE